jgi:transcriptional regulator with GAF, ATPase, and Fis domain
MKKPGRNAEPDINTIFTINDAIAQTRNKTELFNIIFTELEPVFNFLFATIMIYDKSRAYLETLSGSIYGPQSSTKEWVRVPFSEIPSGFSLTDISIISMEEIINSSNRMDDKIRQAQEMNVNDTIACPLKSGGKLIGFLVLAYQDASIMTESKLEFLKQISNPLATAVSNITAYEELLNHEKDIELQLKFINSLVGIKNREEMFFTIASEIRKIDKLQYTGIMIKHPDKQKQSSHLFFMDKGVIKSINPIPDDLFDVLLSAGSLKEDNREYSDADISALLKISPFFRDLNRRTPIKNIICGPGIVDDYTILALLINNSPVEGNERGTYLSNVGPQITLALKNLFAFEENERLREQLEHEKSVLLDEIKVSGGSQDIIGTSTGIKKVLKQVKQVSKTDTTILILGETGVGKELVAKLLHNSSNRKDKVFITVNCASLPAQLIESELFGHEKGSFTGALERRIGKFELADGGTIFLDEIGELPLELQAKLLRVLQEKEFERIGGKELLHTDIRIIAATNRNLQKEVAAGKFRSDLYFRLNVFPILIPALRDRKEDIPLFIQYYTEKHSKRVGVPLRIVNEADLNLLLEYHWPGNIRELEHIIERAVITSTGPFLEFSGLTGHSKKAEDISPDEFKTLTDMEKEHILTALRITNGRISGDNGAAKLLGLNSKTLDSKIKKLGIKKSIVLS